MDVICEVLLVAAFVILITHDSCLSEVYVKEVGQRIVEIKQGQVRGRVIGYPKDPTFKQVEQFAGVRYASLRGGRTRFMPPASVVRKWQHVHDASFVSEVCPQSRKPPSLRFPEGHREQIRRRMFHTNYSQEDCLTLNLVAPIRGNFLFFFNYYRVLVFPSAWLLYMYFAFWKITLKPDTHFIDKSIQKNIIAFLQLTSFFGELQQIIVTLSLSFFA